MPFTEGSPVVRPGSFRTSSEIVGMVGAYNRGDEE
jgi:hypothetical protein